jgi:hypothetical protein
VACDLGAPSCEKGGDSPESPFGFGRLFLIQKAALSEIAKATTPAMARYSSVESLAHTAVMAMGESTVTDAALALALEPPDQAANAR